MKIRKHMPGFAWDGRDPLPEAEFSTLDDLLAVDFVASWKKHPGFLRYSKSDEHLMAEFGPTTQEPIGSYWVIGTLSDPDAVDLPQWVETEAQRLRREAWNRGEIRGDSR